MATKLEQYKSRQRAMARANKAKLSIVVGGLGSSALMGAVQAKTTLLDNEFVRPAVGIGGLAAAFLAKGDLANAGLGIGIAQLGVEVEARTRSAVAQIGA